MTRRKREIPLRSPNDTMPMRDAVEQLQDYAGLRRTSQYQLKIGDTNFYPDTGTVQIDRLSAQKNKGIEEFIRLLRQKSLLMSKGVDFMMYQINPDH